MFCDCVYDLCWSMFCVCFCFRVGCSIFVCLDPFGLTYSSRTRFPYWFLSGLSIVESGALGVPYYYCIVVCFFPCICLRYECGTLLSVCVCLCIFSISSWWIWPLYHYMITFFVSLFNFWVKGYLLWNKYSFLLLLLLSHFSRVRLCATLWRQPTRLPRPWDSPGKNTGVGCHFLLQYVKVKSESEVTQSCPSLWDPMECSPPGFSGIFQARYAGVGCQCLLHIAS